MIDIVIRVNSIFEIEGCDIHVTAATKKKKVINPLNYSKNYEEALQDCGEIKDKTNNTVRLT